MSRSRTVTIEDIEAAEREIERLAIYDYLKEQADDFYAHQGVVIGNHLVRVAAEILRGEHLKPKVTNPDLWR